LVNEPIYDEGKIIFQAAKSVSTAIHQRPIAAKVPSQFRASVFPEGDWEKFGIGGWKLRGLEVRRLEVGGLEVGGWRFGVWKLEVGGWSLEVESGEVGVWKLEAIVNTTFLKFSFL